MFATIIIISLATILVVFISSIVYLVSLVVNEPDDYPNGGPSLGIDSQDFSSTPAVSPNDAQPSSSKSGRHESPLHVALRRQKLQTVTSLLCQGADIEARNEHGETPLIVACKTGNIFACQLLLIFDADFEALDNLGLSARHYIAVTCSRHMGAQQTPSAAHLILAMLHAIGASRCPERNKEGGLYTELEREKSKEKSVDGGGVSGQEAENLQDLVQQQRQVVTKCSDGCSFDGKYNGNSYNRWTNYKRESLYKRHMFSGIIKRKLGQASRWLPWNWLRVAMNKEGHRSRVLSIDGGGLRGVIVCQTLIELQKYLRRPILDYFDWIGGTSVGAFVACALSQGKSLFELRKICFDFKDEVFNGPRPYNSKFLEQVLKKTFGVSSRMSGMRNRKVVVTTTLADRDPCQLYLFRNYKSPSQLLEQQGFAPDHFDIMSAHSIVEKRPARANSIEPPTSGSQAQTQSRASPIARKAPTASSQTSGSASGPPDQTTSLSEGPAQVSGVGPQASEAGLAAASTSATPSEQPIGEARSDDSETSPESPQAIKENDSDPLVWQAVRASAAAPFFFQPYGPFLDGGVIANNPTLDILCEYQSFQRIREFLKSKDSLPSEEEQVFGNLNLVLSLGTGRGRVVARPTMVDFGQVAAGLSTVFSPAEMVRSIRTARDLFKRLMHQSCSTEDHILDRAQAWCSSLGTPYFRINPPLATIFSIDDKRDEQLINALWQTKLYMMTMEPQLKELAHILDKDD